MYRQNLWKNISEQLGQNRDSLFRKPIFIISTKLTTKLVKQSPRNSWDKTGTLLPGSKSLHECVDKTYGKSSQNNWHKIGTVRLENKFSWFPTKSATKLVKQSDRNSWDIRGTLPPGSKSLKIARMYRQHLRKNISEQLGQNRDSSFRKPICTIFTKLTTELVKQSPRNNWHKIVTLLPGSKSLQFARTYWQNLKKNISEQLGQNRDSSFRKPIFIISTKLSTKLVKQSPGNNWHKLGTLLPGSKFLQFARMHRQDLRKNISEQLSQNEDSLFRKKK